MDVPYARRRHGVSAHILRLIASPRSDGWTDTPRTSPARPARHGEPHRHKGCSQKFHYSPTLFSFRLTIHRLLQFLLNVFQLKNKSKYI